MKEDLLGVVHTDFHASDAGDQGSQGDVCAPDGEVDSVGAGGGQVKDTAGNTASG